MLHVFPMFSTIPGAIHPPSTAPRQALRVAHRVPLLELHEAPARLRRQLRDVQVPLDDVVALVTQTAILPEVAG